MLRLLRKWLKAGVIEDGKWSQTPEGAPQGASASPLMAIVYLHYVFDLWADWWRKRYAHGDVIFVRFADDFIAGFEHQADAQRFLADLRERFAKFGLDLHEGKTRLIEFGRHAARRRKARGLGKPETFDFLGFTHICGKTRDGRFGLRRVTISKRMRAKLHELKNELMRRRHQPVPEQGRWLASVVRGHCAYYAVPGNSKAVRAFRTQATRHWHRALRRRSQRTRLNWNAWTASPPGGCPRPGSCIHGRACDSTPAPEAGAQCGIPLAGICAGGRPQGRSLPRPHGSVGARRCDSSGPPDLRRLCLIRRRRNVKL